MTRPNLPTNRNNYVGKTAYVYVTDADKHASDVVKAIQAYDIIPQSMTRGASQRVMGGAEAATNTSVRDKFSRQDYEHFRTNESVPTEPREIIGACMQAYRHVGLVRNIIDLMSDFGAQGVKLVHPNPQRQKFYRAWWKKIGGPERTERALNLLYRCGMFVAKRRTAKINVQMERKMTAQGEDGILTPDSDLDDDLRTQKRNIPIRYTFMNPLMLDVIGGELAQFVGKQYYAVKISSRLRQLVANPNATTKFLVEKLPPEIREAIARGNTAIPLDPDKIAVYHYKKDDWQNWADPMVYPILDDLILYEKMKLADLAALDGAISQVRLWKLGDLEKGIFPTETAVNRLIEILMSNPGGGAFDIVWGPDLQMEDYTTNVHQFLGKAKYEPIKEAIYEGLGVPATLTGGGGGKGMTNNYVSLQTLIKRLDYGRSVVTAFWEAELELVRQAMGHRQAPKIVFDNMILTDEASMKALLIQLVDRDIISIDTLTERFGEDPEIELLKIRRENRMRKQGQMNDKASPWHAPEKFYEYLKLAVAAGYVDIRETGWEPELEDVDTPFKQQMTMQDKSLEVQKDVAKTRASAKPAGGGKKPTPKSKGKGQPSPGRPKNSGDKKKRNSRTPKPMSGASEDFLATMLWAKEAQARIANVVTPGLLEHFGKKNQRELTESEAKQCEYFKFSVLGNMQPFSDVTSDTISGMIETQGTLRLDVALEHIFDQFYEAARSKTKREPTVDEIRMMQTAAYAIIHTDEDKE